MKWLQKAWKNCCWKTIIIPQPSVFMRENGKKSILFSLTNMGIPSTKWNADSGILKNSTAWSHGIMTEPCHSRGYSCSGWCTCLKITVSIRYWPGGTMHQKIHLRWEKAILPYSVNTQTVWIHLNYLPVPSATIKGLPPCSWIILPSGRFYLRDRSQWISAIYTWRHWPVTVLKQLSRMSVA